MVEEPEKIAREKAKEILFNKLEQDNEKLLAENVRLKKIEKKVIGYLIILLSVIIFSLSVFIFITNIQHILVAFFSFALICVAIYFIFIYSPKIYHLNLTNTALQIVSFNLNQALSTFSLEKFSVFLPVDGKVYQYIPYLSTLEAQKYPILNELIANVFQIQNKGIILEPIGESICEFVTNDLFIDLRKNNIDQIENLLQELLIDKLNLVKTLHLIKLEKGQYKLIITDNFFAPIYQLNQSGGPNHIGCPVRSFVAVILAQMTNRAILLKSHEFDQATNTLTVIYELGELYK